MATVSIVGPDDGETPLDGPTRMRILEDGSTTGHRLGLGEITLAPHTPGPQQHRHAQHDEGFYVVSGTARFTVGDRSTDAGPGTLVMVPPGAPHTFANPSDGTTVLLNTFTPDLYVQYFRDLRDMVRSGQPMNDEAVAGVMARYATEPATQYAESVDSTADAATDPDAAPAPHAASAPAPAGTVTLADGLTLTVDDRGTGHPVLVLHGGAGPASVHGLSAALAEGVPVGGAPSDRAATEGLAAGGALRRVLTPTMPGFAGTPRPIGLDSVSELARVYRRLLDELDLHDVSVVGSSVGGWVAAQMALEEQRHPIRRIGRIVLVNAVGITVDDHPITDVSAMPLDQLVGVSFHDPDRFRVDPAAWPAAQRDAMAADAAVFAVYAGDPYMHDPELRSRLAGIDVPALVVWGESDGIVDADYGRAYAGAIGPDGARFVPVEAAGHLPFLERPEATLAAMTDFLED